MAEAKIALGGVLDIASGAEVWDAVQRGTDRILSKLPDKDRGIRLRVPQSVSLAAPATGTFAMIIGTPAPGCMWWIQEVVVTAADDHTALAGAVAALYCGAPPRQQGTTTVVDTPPLGDLLRPGIAVPGVFPFSGEAVPVHDNEALSVIVYSPTTPVSVLSATATVVQLRDSAVMLNRYP